MNAVGLNFEFGDFRLDPTEKTLVRSNGEEVPLPPKAFDLLEYLVLNHGRLLEKSAILDAVWADSFVEEGNLKINIHLLRRTLGDGLIETVPRRGYRFSADVREIEPTEIVLERVTAEALVVERSTAATFPKKLLAAAIVAALAIAVVGFLVVRGRTKTQLTNAAATIAVLPLRNLSPEKDDEYLGIGFTDSLITKLAHLDGISVRPTNSVLTLTPEQSDAKTIRERLGVDRFVEGTIQRTEGKLRISIQLVNANDGSVVWAEQFDDDDRGLLRLQDKITNQIVASMRTAITPNESDMLARRNTSNEQAFEAYLRGRYYWNRRSGDELKKAVKFFEQAKTMDPNFALAYVGLSDTHQLLTEYFGAERSSSVGLARENVLKALELNPEIGEAHCSLAYLQAFYDWDFKTADSSFRKSLELSPNYPTGHQWYGEFLLAMGKNEEALVELKLARSLDPTSLIIQTDFVAYYYATRNFDAAINEAETIARNFPKFAFVRSLLAMAYLQKRDYDGFYKAAMEADEIYLPAPILETRRKAYEAGGLDGLFRLRYEQATNPPLSFYYNDYQRALEALTAREYDAVFFWLGKSVAGKDRWAINLKQDPFWDPIRSDPRFDELLKKVTAGITP